MHKNPIFKDYKSRILYGGVWILITCVQMLVIYLITVLPFGYILTDSVLFNGLLACCLIPLWYPVRFNTWEKQAWRFNFAVHGMLACTIIFVWLLIGNMIMHLIVSDSDYLHFLNISLGWKAMEGLVFYAVAVLVYYLYAYIEQLNEKAANEIRLNKLLKDGELNLLKSQINPHFLFNSLNSLNSLIIKNTEQAQKMLVALSDYLRYAVLSTNRIYSCIEDELENITRYLSIEKLRFGDKLVYESEIDPDCFPAEIPAMLLQPLLENAIKHGVYESLETVRIVLKIHHDTQYLMIELSNDFDTEGTSQKKGSGTGLQNIRERLRLLYGNLAAMDSKVEQGKFIVMLKIPLSFSNDN